MIAIPEETDALHSLNVVCLRTWVDQGISGVCDAVRSGEFSQMSQDFWQSGDHSSGAIKSESCADTQTQLTRLQLRR